jgi:2-haloalkanoic acid dehalogenase type II
MASTRRLHDYSCLTFDCYGTLIEWEVGLDKALKPLYSQLPSTHPLHNHLKGLLEHYSKIERALEIAHPTELYSKLLAETYLRLAAELDLRATEADAKTFAASIGDWPAYPDTVEALQRLKKHFKLVILSNVDNASFAQTLKKQFAGVEFDAVYTAEDIGSYKPDKRNFEYLLQHCDRDLGVKKEQIIHTAVSL